MQYTQDHNGTLLKDINLPVWRVLKAKEQMHQDDVHAQLFKRKRLRRGVTQH